MNLSYAERYCKSIVLAMADRDTSPRPVLLGSGFLLSQLGAHAATRFAALIAPLGLNPPQVGLLRSIGDHPGRSQQAVADEFRLPPSRMVGFIDDLEASGLVERRRDPSDRRVHLLHLSDAGEAMVRTLEGIGKDAEQALFAALSKAERATLQQLLARVADEQGLYPGVHPGYPMLSVTNQALKPPV
jgi:DNA-binding MarR family transcriptional regulator